MKLLVLYGTTEGQTRKIAHFIETEAELQGWKATVYNLTEETVILAGYDAVMVASSIHMGKYQAAVADYAIKNASALNKLPSAFVSVSLTAAGNDEDSWKELHELTDHFLKHCGWIPTETTQVAGALKYTQYDWFKKQLLRMIAKSSGGSVDTSIDHEYTNWEEVKTFVKGFLPLLPNKASS
ncbi:menaquinone-dependent protoporphyrinogen IX dehydrogenase [soil metagenome]